MNLTAFGYIHFKGWKKYSVQNVTYVAFDTSCGKSSQRLPLLLDSSRIVLFKSIDCYWHVSYINEMNLTAFGYILRDERNVAFML